MSDPVWGDLPRWRVPFNWRAFWRKNRFLMATPRNIPRRLGRMGAILGICGVNQVSWLIDQMVAPNWDKVPMNGPVFIIGHQRSGSTLLHRTLASDPNAVALTLGEMLFPAVSARRAINRFYRWDDRHRRRIQNRMDAFQDRRLAAMDEIHHARLNTIEEDEFVLFTVYRSGMSINTTPAVAADPELNRLRDFSTWTERERRLALGWYRACLMKAVYLREAAAPNPDRWIVGKNPAFSQRIPDLLKVFPRAKFINLVRNPLETIPSRLSLVQAVWRVNQKTADTMSPQEIAEIVADSERTYLLAERDLRDLPSETAITVRFDDLTTDLAGTVARIYRQLGLPGTPPDRDPESVDGQRRGAHKYTLGEFGLTEAGVRERLAPIFERYGF